MKNTLANPVLDKKSDDPVELKEDLGKVDVVVQEYMDNLLSDLFPEMEIETEEPITKAVTSIESVSPPINTSHQTETKIEVPPKVIQPALVTEPKQAAVAVEKSVVEKPDQVLNSTEGETQSIPVQAPVKTYAKVIPHVPLPEESIEPQVTIKPSVPVPQTAQVKPKVQAEPVVKPSVKPEVMAEVKIAPRIQPKEDVTLPAVELPATDKTPEVAVTSAQASEQIEKRFPNAPDWAQESFDVLLFDVCGLKLAVPMESLGKIIKVEHETNQLIGRPSWFMGAYNEAEEHLYVVDTAKYIMPEKGYDLSVDGFSYLIQMQRSKWTLACKNVHTTVRLEPDQVKWRSNQGKRQWLSGTVIEHMCALIHVDNLVELLEADS